MYRLNRVELLRGFDEIAFADDVVALEYQRDALGWFDFLRRFGFGGCLADEMGLGKTVMVLAAMEGRRLEHKRTGRASRPSLIVVPRSLVFNWRQEAARFAPALRVLDFTIGGRRGALDEIGEHDIVLTTYGTLRRDIGHLKEIAFDYAILDRGTGDQERAHQLGEGRAPVEGGPPARAQRNSSGESSRRALEPVRLPESRHSWRGVILLGGERVRTHG